MSDFCADAFAERAAIMEFCGGLPRFEAETLAAKAQGLTRWQAMGALNGNGMGNPEPARDRREPAQRNGQGSMPMVQPQPAQQDRSVSERDFPSGRAGVALPSLRGERR